MCGLVFQYNPSSPADDALKRMEAALTAIEHRGPDELKTLRAGPAYFAHARLSILDLAASKQPMQSPDGRFTLVFNGEIYNFGELRARLDNRWSFRTSGDTETLLAGLILEGTAFISDLEGMWAFAFWDSATETLLASRDRMGKKPLFYTAGEGLFSCASELSALATLTEGNWSEDVDSVADYFRYGHCLPGYTMFAGVYELKPANILIWRPGMAVEQKPYWSISEVVGQNRIYSDDDLRQAFVDAVKKRLVADVEVGGFLSGGIDSSLVCSTAQSLMSQRLRTYTIGFSESSFDESHYAKAMAAEIGSDHSCEIFEEWDETQLENLVLSHVGQPYADASLLPTAMVCERASRDLKVVLSGDGADELFGGYQRYQAQVIFRWYARLPKSLRKLAEKAIKQLPSPMVHHSRSILKKAQLFVDAAERHETDPLYVAPRLFSQSLYDSLVPELNQGGHKNAELDHATNLGDLQRMLFADTAIYLPQDILTKVDRASMAHSLEVRSPFLDSRVVEIAFSREANRHLDLGKGKKWLRSAFANQLPPWVWRRRKQGFGVPLGIWFKGELGDRLLSLLEQNETLLAVASVKEMLRCHRAGIYDYSMGLWAIYVYLAARKL